MHLFERPAEAVTQIGVARIEPDPFVIANDGFGKTVQRSERRGETLKHDDISGIERARCVETLECGLKIAASGTGVAFGAPC
jgi:hypothetical protein